MKEDYKQKALIRLIDDDEELGNAMKFMLLSEGWRYVYYSDPELFLREEDCTQPGCIILDYQMQNISGVEVQEILLSKSGYVPPIIFLTAHADVDMAIRTFRQGAFNILKKPVDSTELINQIESAVRKDLDYRTQTIKEISYEDTYASLTRRERQIVDLVLMGLMNTQIATRFNLSERTIESHRANIYKRLKVKNLQELKEFMSHIKPQRQ